MYNKFYKKYCILYEIFVYCYYPFQRKSLGKEGIIMTSYDLIWRLIELLLQDKETNTNGKSQKED